MTRTFSAYTRTVLLLCVAMLLGTAVAQEPITTPTETVEAPTSVVEQTETPVVPAPESTPEPTAVVIEPTAVVIEPTTSGDVLGIPTPNVPVEQVPPLDGQPGRFDPNDPLPPVETDPLPRDSRLPYDLTKLDISLQTLIASYAIGDTVGVEATARDFYLPKDAKGRFFVKLTAAEGFNGNKLLRAIESVGGKVLYREGREVYARLSEGHIALLSANAAVGFIAPQSTGRAEQEPTSIPDTRAPAGSVVTNAFDSANALSWHNFGNMGDSIKIGIIDFGFGNSTTASPELSCLNSYPSISLTFGGAITSAPVVTRRGLDMAEVVCDIAPSARVRLYKVTTSGNLYDAIDSADNVNDVIIIGADFGADFSPGDGTFGRSSAKNVYAALATAKANGVVVVVAAGNTNEAYTAFNFTGTSVSLSGLSVKPGDTVNVSWNDWDDAPNAGSLREDIGITLTGTGISLTKPARGGGNPSHQFTIPASCTLVGEFCQNVNMSFNGFPSGDTSSVVVQVSISGGLNRDIGTLSIPALSQFGRLSRPADSADVIAVGAVCADFKQHFPSQTYSSNGPIYGVGGSQFPAAPLPLASVDVKPDVVGADSVSVSSNLNSDLLCNAGFRGTQAGAAHVGAMAALLLNNSLVSGFNSIAAPANIMHYMRTHSVDLPLSPDAKGYDNEFGAGLPVLGQPDYDYDSSLNAPIFAAPNNVPVGECANGVVYVGPRNTGNNILIPQASEYPYQSIMQAVYSQAILGPGRCVIVLPGEYSSPLLLGSIPLGVGVYGYGSVTLTGGIEPTIMVAQNRVWGDFAVVNSTRSAAVYVENSQSVTVGGFKFVSGAVLNDAVFEQSQILAVEASDDFTLTRSSVNNVTSNKSLLEIFDGSVGATISESTFTNNRGRSGASLIAVYSSGSASERVSISGSHFENNRNTEGAWASRVDYTMDWVPMIRSFESYVDVVNNVMRSNSAETLIQGFTEEGTDNHELRILGNVIVNTQIRTDDFVGGTGPLIHGFFNRYIMIVNNTIAGSRFDGISTPFSTLIGRGDNGLNPFQIGPSDGNGGFLPCLNDCGSLTEQWARWELRGNLLMNNASAELIRDVDTTPGFNGGACVEFAEGASPIAFQSGARHNWFYNTGTFANCDGSVNTLSYGNIVNGNPMLLIKGGPDATAPDYYSPFAPTAGEPNMIDDGPEAFASTVLPDFHNGVDVRGNLRASNNIDIGAYEYSPFVIQSPIPRSAAEDSGVLEFNVVPFVNGGFPPYTVSVVNFPSFYGTHCDARFASPITQGTAAQTISDTTATFAYCPPRNFHTSTAPILSGIVPITVQIRDASGAGGLTTINYTITPVNDVALTTSMTTTVAAATSRDPGVNIIRLRPYVDLGNNFFFSETNNPDTSGTGPRRQVDYDFTYTQPTLVIGAPENTVNAASIILTAVNPNTGVVGVNTLALASEESGRFQYNVTDRNGNMVTNFVIINVVTPPVPFNQTVPLDNLTVNNIDTLSTFQWEVSGNATTYDLAVYQNIPGVLTPLIDVPGLVPGGGSLTCTTICVYTIPPAEKQKLAIGSYIWIVKADKQGLKLEAENSPLRFSINTGRELITNGGFEIAGAPARIPASWSLVNFTGDKRKCGAGVGGSCMFMFKGSPVSAAILTQKPARIGRRADTLAFSAAIKTANLGANRGVLRVVVKYTTNEKEKLVLTAPSGTTDFTSISTAPLILRFPVRSYKVNVIMNIGGGKMFVDNVSLVLDETMSFNLISPSDDDTVIANPAYITELTWEPSASAVSYEVDLNRIFPPAAIVDSSFTAAADGDPLTCAQGLCVLNLTPNVLTTGNYIWTVTAANGSTPANAPFNFSVDTTNIIEMVANGNFEQKNASGMPKLWTSSGLQLSTTVCEAGVVHPEYQGACAFRFVGGANLNATLSQTLSKAGLAVGDQLTLRAAAQLSKAVAGSMVKLQVKYTNGQKATRTITLPGGSTDWLAYVADPIELTSAVKSVKLTVNYRGIGGSVNLDNISVIRQPVTP